jgi:hypothetical protein
MALSEKGLEDPRRLLDHLPDQESRGGTDTGTGTGWGWREK